MEKKKKSLKKILVIFVVIALVMGGSVSSVLAYTDLVTLRWLTVPILRS